MIFLFVPFYIYYSGRNEILDTHHQALLRALISSLMATRSENSPCLASFRAVL